MAQRILYRYAQQGADRGIFGFAQAGLAVFSGGDRDRAGPVSDGRSGRNSSQIK
jgi:hypothetical protein